MKVALVRKNLSVMGGAEKYTVSLARELIKLEHEVHIFTDKWNKDTEGSDCIFHRVPLLKLGSVCKNLTFAWNSVRQLEKGEFDIVQGLSRICHQDVSRVSDGVHLVWLEQRYRGYRKWLERWLNPRHIAILWLEKRMFSPAGSRRIIVNSEMCKAQVLKWYRVSPERISVIYNGIDQEKFNLSVRGAWGDKTRSLLGIKKEETVILFVGKDLKRKGLCYLVEAISHLGEEKRNCRLLVVGTDRKEYVESLAKKYNLAGRVITISDTKEIEKYYAASDTLVLPTLYDPFSNVCLEAMACGLPVITTRQNGAAELIVEGENGFCLDKAQDTECLAEYISFMLSPAERMRMGSDANRMVLRYTQEANARQTADVYAGIVREKGYSHVAGFSWLDGKKLLINNSFKSLLEKNRFDKFDSMMYCHSDKIAKNVLSYRNTYRLVLNGNGEEVVLFLKRHCHLPWRERLRSALTFCSAHSAAGREWENILRFQRVGLPTARPVAVGQKLHWGIERESFLLTTGITGGMRLDDYIKKYFSPPLEKELVREKRALVVQLAKLTRSMHRANLHHRDYYLCHIFVVGKPLGKKQVYLIDLQRAGYRRPLRSRWKVKDIASLNYSLPAGCITQTDKLRFLRTYWESERWGREEYSFVKRILRKTARIAAHDRQYQK